MICTHCGADLRDVGITEVLEVIEYQERRYNKEGAFWDYEGHPKTGDDGEHIAYRCAACFEDVTPEQAQKIGSEG